MNDEQLKTFQDKHGFGILHFPTVLGAAVPTYNITGVDAALNFTPDALAGIFLGKITKWNDPPSLSPTKASSFPPRTSSSCHRAEGSGTTYIWTDYLSGVSDEWKTKVGRGASVNWPVGIGGKGNEGVTGTIKNTPKLHWLRGTDLRRIQQNSLRQCPELRGRIRKGFSRRRLARPRLVRPRKCRMTSAFPSSTPPARPLIPFPASPGF